MKIVLHTNVLISALVKVGKPRDLLFEILLNHEFIISKEVLKEECPNCYDDTTLVPAELPNELADYSNSYV